MLTISKSLSAGQARTYHSREFTSEEQNYWSRDQQAHSEWQGRLAQEWGLDGEVGSEHFARLSEGQHPESGLQLVKHQPGGWPTFDFLLLTPSQTEAAPPFAVFERWAPQTPTPRSFSPRTGPIHVALPRPLLPLHHHPPQHPVDPRLIPRGGWRTFSFSLAPPQIGCHGPRRYVHSSHTNSQFPR